MKHRCCIAGLVCLLLTVVASVASAQGPGDLLVAPTRIIFEGQTRNVIVSLINMGNDTNSYVITLQNYRMTEDGLLEEITSPDSGQLFANELVRYFPRQVVLAPKEEQTLRMQLTKSANLPVGEYRSHIYLRAIPRARVIDSSVASAPPVGLSMRLTPVYGVILPIIIRHGDVSVGVQLANLNLERDTATQRISLSLQLQRDGLSSAYGDISVTYQPVGGTPIPVSAVNGVAIYTPNHSRSMHLPLTLPEGIELGQGRLLVEYRSRSSLHSSILGSAELAIP